MPRKPKPGPVERQCHASLNRDQWKGNDTSRGWLLDAHRQGGYRTLGERVVIGPSPQGGYWMLFDRMIIGRSSAG